MTKSTTAECIEWLNKEIKAWANSQEAYERDGEHRQAAVCVNNATPLRHIRAQLIAHEELIKYSVKQGYEIEGLQNKENAAQEMEKALNHCTPETYDEHLAHEALKAWRKAGGK